MIKTRRLVFIFATVLLALAGLYLYIPGFLALDRPVESRNVLVEAWIPASEIERAVLVSRKGGTTQFYIAGRMYPVVTQDPPPWTATDSSVQGAGSPGIWLYANSSLEFRLPEGLPVPVTDTVDLTVVAMGQGAAGYDAFFNLIVNGRVVGGSFASEGVRHYPFKWVPGGQSMKTLFVRFNNDLKTDTADRNLQVLAVIVDGRRIEASRPDTRISREMNTVTTGFDSQAEETADYIRHIGVPEGQVHAVVFDPPERNLTLAAARAFREYSSRKELGSFNVVSSGLHCRRTWMTYQKTFGHDARVGVMNFHPEGYSRKSEYGNRPFVLSLADELFSYLATWFELTF